MSERAIRKALSQEIHNYAADSRDLSHHHDDFYRAIKGGSSLKTRATEVAFIIFDAEEDGRRLTEREEDKIIIEASKMAVEYFVACDQDEDDNWCEDATNKELDRMDAIIRGVEKVLGCRGDELKIDREDRRPPRVSHRDDRSGSRREGRRDVREGRTERSRRNVRESEPRSRRNQNRHGAHRNRLSVPTAQVEEPVQQEVRQNRRERTVPEQMPEKVADRYFFQHDMQDKHPEMFNAFHEPEGEFAFPTVYQSSAMHPVYVVSQSESSRELFIKRQEFIDINSDEGIELTRIGELHEGYLILRRQDSAELEDLQAGIDVIRSLVPASMVLEPLANGEQLAVAKDLNVKHRFVTIGTFNDNVELSHVQIHNCIPEDVEVDTAKDIVSVMSRDSFEYTIRADGETGKLLAAASAEGKTNLSGLHTLLTALRPTMDPPAWYELNQAITREVNSLLTFTLGVGALSIDSFFLDWDALEAHLTETYGSKLATALTGRGKAIAAQLIRYVAIETEEGDQDTDVWLTNCVVDLLTAVPIKSNDLDLASAQAGKIAMVSNAVTPLLYTALSSVLDIKDRLGLRSCFIVTRDRVAIEVTRHILTKAILIKIL